MAKKRLVLEFDSVEDRQNFVGWFLDGGGEYQFNEGREAHGLPHLQTESHHEALWDWQIDPLADEHVILLPPFPEEEDE